jgi:hypothetical protein
MDDLKLLVRNEDEVGKEIKSVKANCKDINVKFCIKKLCKHLIAMWHIQQSCINR